MYGIHILVAYMFNNPFNNHMSNLEWTTSSQNTKYSA